MCGKYYIGPSIKSFLSKENLYLERPQIPVFWSGEALARGQGGVWAVWGLAGGHQEPGWGKLPHEIWEHSRMSWVLDRRYSTNPYNPFNAIPSLLYFFYSPGNDIGLTGVWTHAQDNTDVTWFPNVRTCSGADPQQISHGGDALTFYIGCQRINNGAYCDPESTSQHLFICEGLLWITKINEFNLMTQCLILTTTTSFSGNKHVQASCFHMIPRLPLILSWLNVSRMKLPCVAIILTSVLLQALVLQSLMTLVCLTGKL